MPRFINQSEVANFSENAARNEIIKNNGAIIVYSGTPDLKNPDESDNGDWTICRTTVTQANGVILVDTVWARGTWTERTTLTYKYL